MAAALPPVALSLFFIILAWNFQPGQVIKADLPWVTALDVPFSLALDGLSLLLALLISTFGVVVIIYGGEYLKHHRDVAKFYFFILIFMFSMLGLVLADNLLILFTFWEMTTFSSFLLIGFEHDKIEARESAWQAILISAGGSLFLLAGFLLLAQITGSYEISTILTQGETIKAHALYVPTLLLILVGAFTKSAQFPFHFWLPAAMTAPTPVSAYLHSATMVKAGIYLLARFSPVLAQTDLWFYLVAGTGLVTMLTGSILALQQTDLKLLLAYMTLMALGTLTMLLGIGGEAAIKSCIIFLLAHSLYKGCLFLVAGSVDHATGTRDIAKLGGLSQKMRLTTAIAALAILSMAGLPPLLGFVGKEMIYKGAAASWYLTGAAVVAKSIATAVAGLFFFKTFFQKPQIDISHAHDAPVAMWSGPMLMAIVGLCLGLFPGWMDSALVRGSVEAIVGEKITSDVYPGIGLNLPLLLSLISVAMGGLIYWYSGQIRIMIGRLEPLVGHFGAAAIYRQGMKGLVLMAKWQTALLQTGSPRYYLSWTFTIITFFTAHALLWQHDLHLAHRWSGIEFYEWIIVVLIALAALLAVIARTVLASVTLLGMVGFGVALLYAFYGAPDLALTQFLVETLTIIVLVLMAGKLPNFKIDTKINHFIIRDAVLSLAFGAVMVLLLWQVIDAPFAPELNQYFEQKSLAVAHGRNIVNVILVDFRALDTLGEITVLAMGSLGVFSLLKLARYKKKVR